MKIHGTFKTYASDYLLKAGYTFAVVSVGTIPNTISQSKEQFFSEVFIIQKKDNKILKKSLFTIKSPVVFGIFDNENDFLNKEVLPRLNEYFNYKILLPLLETTNQFSIKINN